MVRLVPILRMQALRIPQGPDMNHEYRVHRRHAPQDEAHLEVPTRTVRDIRGERRDDVLKGRVLHVDV